MMEPLSLEHININSSYLVEPTDKDGYYQFFTDSEVHYSHPVTAKCVIQLFLSLTNSSTVIIPPYSIFVRQETTNKACVVASLNIGSLLIIVKPFLQ